MTVAGARAILKTSSNLGLAIKAACQLEPQEGPLARASACGPYVAWAPSRHDRRFQRQTSQENWTELCRSLRPNL